MSRLLHRRLAIAAVGAFSLAMLAGGPAMASHTGTVGSHSLRDSTTAPGDTCKYREITDPPYESVYVLKRITVAPPRVRAISGTQKVGWKFTVQRKESFEGASTGWLETYSSPIQTAMTNSAHDAAFTSKTVSVIGAHTDTLLRYRVLVTMLWYRANGSIQGTAIQQVHWYKLVGPAAARNKDYCYGVDF